MSENNENTVFETGRLFVCEIPESDIGRYQEIVDTCNSGIWGELAGLTAEEFAQRHRAYIKYQYGFYGYGIWGLYLKSTGEMIGIGGVWNSDESEIGEIGYAVMPKYRMQGYAKEAAEGIVSYALEEIEFKGLTAQIEKDNEASLKVVNGLRCKVKIIE